jgi:hypothetical protein
MRKDPDSMGVRFTEVSEQDAEFAVRPTVLHEGVLVGTATANSREKYVMKQAFTLIDRGDPPAHGADHSLCWNEGVFRFDLWFSRELGNV